VKKQVSLTPVLAIALVIIAAVTFFVLIKPKLDESSRLDSEIADLEGKIAVSSRAKPKGEPKVEINVADLFLLAKAMPDDDDMAGIILELNGIASSAGVRFNAIQPQDPVAAGSYNALPISLTFEGNYYDLTDFLYRLRNLVTVRDGVLDASGRLYTLDSLDMHEAEAGFPQIEAVLTVSAYSFGAPSAAPGTPASAPAGTTTGTDTTQTTTGTTTGTTTTEGTSTSPANGVNDPAAGTG
jgi:Tfp pilus assembly protein PilO